VTPAAGCPSIGNPEPNPLLDVGTIVGPTGEYRVCDLPRTLTASANLPRIPGLLYALNGRVDVGNDNGAVPNATAAVVLTIQPGVVVYAKTGTSWLAVNRGNRIQAVGTAERPIVFTSRDNVLGLVDDAAHGQWGGVVLLGRAPITDCTVAPAAPPGTDQCERDTEGAAERAYYGGATPADNSGTMSYVQIRYSGYTLAPGNELQSLTLGGVGSATTINHIQMHNSSDDGFENFGGRVKMRHIVVTGADDDSVDVDDGYKGTIQYLIAVQKNAGGPDSIIELDSTNANEAQAPRTNLKISNFTFVHRNPATPNTAALLFRGGADVTLLNGVLSTPMACLRFNGANILATDPGIDKIGAPVFQSVAFSCGTTAFVAGTGVTVQQTADAFNAGANNASTFTPTLTNTFINGANETAVVAVNPQTVDAEFDAIAAPYIGAVRDANDTWYAGWTCNSATANFGTTSTACTTLPSLAN
jgi:hypothetical protein